MGEKRHRRHKVFACADLFTGCRISTALRLFRFLSQALSCCSFNPSSHSTFVPSPPVAVAVSEPETLVPEQVEPETVVEPVVDVELVEEQPEFSEDAIAPTEPAIEPAVEPEALEVAAIEAVEPEVSIVEEIAEAEPVVDVEPVVEVELAEVELAEVELAEVELAEAELTEAELTEVERMGEQPEGLSEQPRLLPEPPPKSPILGDFEEERVRKFPSMEGWGASVRIVETSQTSSEKSVEAIAPTEPAIELAVEPEGLAVTAIEAVEPEVLRVEEIAALAEVEIEQLTALDNPIAEDITELPIAKEAIEALPPFDLEAIILEDRLTEPDPIAALWQPEEAEVSDTTGLLQESPVVPERSRPSQPMILPWRLKLA
ncbi:MAG: hypothetical protein HC781_12635 [Leptolyngbyaceae cyanobacterium CSU_1_4]|nr:hypothetical protein [Leptolyngbyaceae cyanobacterium CSU_1_4]